MIPNEHNIKLLTRATRRCIRQRRTGCTRRKFWCHYLQFLELKLKAVQPTLYGVVSVSVVIVRLSSRGPRDVDPWPEVGGGEGPAGLKKIYYICFEKLFLRPCSNVKRISGTSDTIGHLITYKRSSSAQLNRIFAVFVIIVHGLDEAVLFI